MLRKDKMERTYKLERLYPLAQYANIKFVDEISNLPDAVVFDSELASRVRYLQMLEIELAYKQYVNLLNTVGELPSEEAIVFLNTEKLATLQEIATKLDNTKKEI